MEHTANKREALVQLGPFSRAGFFALLLEFVAESFKVHFFEQFVDAFGADFGLEERSVLDRVFVKIIFIKHHAFEETVDLALGLFHAAFQFRSGFVVLEFLEFGFIFGGQFGKQTRAFGLGNFGHDITGEVDHLLNVGGRNAENKSDARRHAAEEPNVGNRNAKLNMTHAFTAHYSAGNFNSALLASNALVANTAILLAGTLVVLNRTENAFIEEAVLFRTLGAVVDGFGLGDFAVRPLKNALGTGEFETHFGEWLRSARASRRESAASYFVFCFCFHMSELINWFPLHESE